MSTALTVLIADDHAMFSHALASWLDQQPDVRVVDVTGSADDAVDRALEHQPDVVLLDVDMPGMISFDAAGLIMSRCPHSAVVFVSAYSDDDYLRRALEVRAPGYLLKSDPPDVLLLALRKVAAGEFYFSSALSGQIVIDSDGAHIVAHAQSLLAALTPREREVLVFIARGLAKKEIARELCVSVKTVNAHTANLMRKLKIHNRVELTLLAIREGLTEA